MADTDKLYEILNYYGLKTNIEDTKKWVKQYVGDALTGITTDLMISGTYEQIKGWRDNGELKPGMLYRMTDYVTKVYSEDGSVSSAEHPFDLILFADSKNCLNENILPALHDGDEYFKEKIVGGETYHKWKFDDEEKNYCPYYILTKEREFEAPSEGEQVNNYELFYAHFECTSFGYDEYMGQNGYHLILSDINGEYSEYVGGSTPNYLYWDEHEDFEAFVNWTYPYDGRTLWIGDGYSQMYVGAKGDIVVKKNLDNLTTSYNAPNGLYQPDLMLSIDEESWEEYSNWERREKGIIYANEDTMTIGGKMNSFDQYHKDEYFYDEKDYTYDGTITIGEKVFPISLQSWEVKYCIDNDTNRFKFADTENGKGVIYYMKDEYNNEAPFDFKNILQNDGEYTFGNDGEDYSLLGYNNGIYNNKILPCVDSETGKQTINQIRVTDKDCHTNLFKPTCVNSYINFPISECDISMNNDGELVVFKTADFISGIENHTIKHDYRKDYLTFEAVNDDTEIIFKTYTDDSTCTRTIEVSKDKVNWESKTSSENGTILATLNAGEKLYLRGDNSSYAYYYDVWDDYLPNFILPLNDCYVYGNVMSLIDSNNFRTLTEITDEYALYSLFYDYWNGDYSSEYVLSHQDKKLVLPATELAQYCYSNIFYGCSSLTTAPELPATTLANYCYNGMFYNCSSLTTAPELPATELAQYCYNGMFHGCTSLTTAPELPATTLATNCYNGMFQGCTSLTTVPELPATTLKSECYGYMFDGCTSLTTAPELPATTLATNCYNGMFYNCGSLTTAPELPATTLANYCYNGMFYNCSSLTTAPELPATALTMYCYAGMFQGCTSLTTAPELPATTLANYCYSYMFHSCTSLTTAPELPATTLANYCYANMFASCTSLVNLPESLPITTFGEKPCGGMFSSCTSLVHVPKNFLPATNLVFSCYHYMFVNCSSLVDAPDLPATSVPGAAYYRMFEGCPSLTTAPELPATSLTSECYYRMFYGCTNLNYIKCLAVNGINRNSSTTNWVSGVQINQGTFVKSPDTTSWPTGNNGIPNNWTVEDAVLDNNE